MSSRLLIIAPVSENPCTAIERISQSLNEAAWAYLCLALATTIPAVLEDIERWAEKAVLEPVETRYAYTSYGKDYHLVREPATLLQ